MKTYLMKCGEFYKIGKSQNPHRRHTHINCSNPILVSLEYVCSEDIEKLIHTHLEHRCIHPVKGEWFEFKTKLSREAFREILEIMKLFNENESVKKKLKIGEKIHKNIDIFWEDTAEKYEDEYNDESFYDWGVFAYHYLSELEDKAYNFVTELMVKNEYGAYATQELTQT